MIYAVPEIRSDALTRTYVSDILAPALVFTKVLVAKQTTVDLVKTGVPTVKTAERVT